MEKREIIERLEDAVRNNPEQALAYYNDNALGCACETYDLDAVLCSCTPMEILHDYGWIDTDYDVHVLDNEESMYYCDFTESYAYDIAMDIYREKGEDAYDWSSVYDWEEFLS